MPVPGLQERRPSINKPSIFNNLLKLHLTFSFIITFPTCTTRKLLAARASGVPVIGHQGGAIDVGEAKAAPPARWWCLTQPEGPDRFQRVDACPKRG